MALAGPAGRVRRLLYAQRVGRIVVLSAKSGVWSCGNRGIREATGRCLESPCRKAAAGLVLSLARSCLLCGGIASGWLRFSELSVRWCNFFRLGRVRRNGDRELAESAVRQPLCAVISHVRCVQRAGQYGASRTDAVQGGDEASHVLEDMLPDQTSGAESRHCLVAAAHPAQPPERGRRWCRPVISRLCTGCASMPRGGYGCGLLALM